MQRLCGRGLLLSLAVAAAAVMAARLMGWWRPRASFRLFIPEELARYRGGPGDPGLYLALLGRVYDVSSGRRHYEPGAHYSGFAGIGEAAAASASLGATPNAHRSFVPLFIPVLPLPVHTSPRREGPSCTLRQLRPLRRLSFPCVTYVREISSFLWFVTPHPPPEVGGHRRGPGQCRGPQGADMSETRPRPQSPSDSKQPLSMPRSEVSVSSSELRGLSSSCLKFRCACVS